MNTVEQHKSFLFDKVKPLVERRDIYVVYMEKICNSRNKNWQDTKDVLLSDF